MGTETTSGLALAKGLSRNRSERVKQLKDAGKKIIGYLCCYPPLEILTAADLVPFRIMGNLKATTVDADAYIETNFCPYIRSCFEYGLHGGYDFLDGIVVPHSCDNVQRIYDFWKYYLKPGYSFLLNVPHVVTPSSLEFFRLECDNFKRSIEGLIGQEISVGRLREAVQLHNENRALVRRLYDARKGNPPLISGTEISQVVIAGMSLPVIEYNDLLRKVLDEVATRKAGPPSRAARLLVSGSEIDDVAFMRLIEKDCGANVVMDDLCIGTRSYWHDVEVTDDPLVGLAERYLDKIPCPRTYREYPATREEDLENRFGYLKRYADEFDVNGIILYVLRFCDIHELGTPDIVDYLQGKHGLPVLLIENDYTMAALGQLRTRIEAFVELIG